jgi:hypothetical protein
MIWPFNLIQKRRETRAMRRVAADVLAYIEDAWPIGLKFKYCGRSFVVCGHSPVMVYPGLHATPSAQVNAHYADGNGVIHMLPFQHAHALAVLPPPADDVAGDATITVTADQAALLRAAMDAARTVRRQP